MNDVKSINRVQVVGTLKEMNLEKITKEVSLGEKKVTCGQFAKKEFKNPMFVVEVNGNDVGVDFFPVSEKKLDENGKVVDNPKFKAMETVLSTYVPKSKDTENATRVKIDGTLRANEYVDKNTFEFKSFPSLNGFQISSTNVPAEDIADCEISGVIKNIYKEVRGDNEEETGRLKVDFLYVDSYAGAIYPTTFLVESDLADDFEQFYEVGQSVKLYYEILVKQIGQKKVASGGFGRRESHIVSGYSITEYSVFRGDEPFEEENDYYISVEKVKELLEERDVMIENKIKEAKTGASGTVANTTVKKTPFGDSESKPKAKTEKKNPFI